jgi:hypothetical protein
MENKKDSCSEIILDANKAVKGRLKVSKGRYESALLRRDLSVEDKKRKLADSLYELVISTFSLHPEKIRKESDLAKIRENADLIRRIIYKIKDINYYLEESFLREAGIIKKSSVAGASSQKNPEAKLRKAQKAFLKDYLGKIESTIYNLMGEIIFFDSKLIKEYKLKKGKAVKNEKIGVSSLEKTLKNQSAILDMLEAKIPPSGKLKMRLFSKNAFNRWMPLVFALLSSFRAEYKKEVQIFLIIKKNDELRRQIEEKISHLVNEKESILKAKEERATAMDGTVKMVEGHRQTFHDYIASANL